MNILLRWNTDGSCIDIGRGLREFLERLRLRV